MVDDVNLAWDIPRAMDESSHEKTRRGDTRSDLLESAAGLLEERGMEAVTLRAVGERAGVSRQAPYKHFSDKGELLSVLAARYFEGLAEAMISAADGTSGNPLARLEAMLEAYARVALGSPARYRLMFGPEVRNRPYPEVHEAARGLYGRLVGVVAECQEAGKLPGGDPVDLAALVYATVHGAVDLALAGHAEEKGLDDPLALVRLLLASLGGTR